MTAGFPQHGNIAKTEQAIKLGTAIDRLIQKNYGGFIAPAPIITPFGIGPLDTLLGGGLISSGPVMLSSTPETGKSTAAFQFSAAFQKQHPNSMIVYLDVEGSGNTDTTQFRISRIDTFGLDRDRFKYEPILLDVMNIFQLIEMLVDTKKKFEEAANAEFYLLIIWDSVASTPSSKTKDSDDPNQIIGLKARQLSFCLDKYNPLLKFNKITFICIDQVRANISMEGPYAQKEKSVGAFKDIKSASNTYSLQHNIQQWLHLSKKKNITLADGMGVDGWYVDIFTEKNKLAAGQHWITCVFDKGHGFDKFWSEYHFLSEPTPGEARIYKNKKMPFPLAIQKSGAFVNLSVTDPSNPSNTYTSDSFYKKDAKHKYETDQVFRQWFDFAVQIGCYYRIINGLFLMTQPPAVTPDTVDDNVEEHVLTEQPANIGEMIDTTDCTSEQVSPIVSSFDPETGEVFEPDSDNEYQSVF